MTLHVVFQPARSDADERRWVAFLRSQLDGRDDTASTVLDRDGVLVRLRVTADVVIRDEVTAAEAVAFLTEDE